MDKSPIVDSLRELCTGHMVEIACLINKNGDVEASVGSIEPLQLETFGIMAATIFGAASTANDQLKKNKPNKIIVDSPDGDTVIRGLGKKYLLVVRTKKDKDLDELYQDLNRTAASIMRRLD